MPRRSVRKQKPGPTKGLYANYFEIGHTAFEVVVDFGQTYEGSVPTSCHTRIVMSPVYARALLETLSDALKTYKGRFGEAE